MKKIAVIGAGIFGVVSALELSKTFTVTLFESNNDIMLSASYTNQARVHRGYHYPRSDITTEQCIRNYEEFEKFFEYSIIRDFKQYYCISKFGSKISPSEYLDFMDRHNLNYKIEHLHDSIINNDMISLSVLVEEYAFDAVGIRQTLKSRLASSSVKLCINSKIIGAETYKDSFHVDIRNSTEETVSKENFDFVVNATYSNLNGIIDIFGLNKINVNHQLTEMIIVDAKDYRSTGITIMDGDFMSIMPFNKSGLSSLSNVRLTPHESSNNIYPKFSCNTSGMVDCSFDNLAYCNTCVLKPKSNFDDMIRFASRYIPFATNIEFVNSLVTIKTIVDNPGDGRPSVIYVDQNKCFVSILAGKVDTVFDIARQVSAHFSDLNLILEE